MHVKSLKIYCDTVSLRSFSKAADENGVSQSNASHVVHQLEERLGVQLIDRSTRPFRLTPAGERYYDGCRGIVRKYFDLEEEVRTLHDRAASRLTVAAIFSVGFGHMKQCLQGFRVEHPKVDVRMEYYHPQRVYASVESGEADLGIVGHPTASRLIGVIPWRDERLVLAVPSSHRLAGRHSVDLSEIDGEKVVAIERGLKLREVIDEELVRRAIKTEVVAEFDNIETIKRAIEAGEGVSVLPEPTIASELAIGSLASVAIEGQPLTRPLGVIFRCDEEMSDSAEQFVAYLRECARHGANAALSSSTVSDR